MKIAISLLLALTFALAVGGQEMGAVDPAVQKQLGASLTAYYGLKDALVDSNVETASSKAAAFAKTFDGVDATKMNEAQKTQWGKLEKLLRNDASHIEKNKELAHQREHFMKLSNNMYSLVSSFKANDAEAYLHYCPMKKASWLSDSKDVKNPYYGKKMLTCGSVKATLKKAGE
jgi:Protein of unknown function (DUF3347)